MEGRQTVRESENERVSQLTISEVARQVGLKPSAIRYYERLGILPRADRASGQRRYDRTVLYRLAVIQRARQAGFTLDEIKALFCGFAEGTRADARWRRLADRKLIELNALAERIATMQALLERLKANCHCKTLEICGKTILEKGVSNVRRPPLPVIPASRL
jgi:MerR family transcriptional regulator, redox-sensitive transcriptional activator SoxR